MDMRSFESDLKNPFLGPLEATGQKIPPRVSLETPIRTPFRERYAAYEARFDLPHVYCALRLGHAARQVERWAFYFVREMDKAMNDIRRCSRLPQSRGYGARTQAG
jgi:hypothetical protein